MVYGQWHGIRRPGGCHGRDHEPYQTGELEPKVGPGQSADPGRLDAIKKNDRGGDPEQEPRQEAVASLSVAVMLAAVWVLNARGFFAMLGDAVQERIPLAIISGLLGGVLSVAHNVSKVDPKRKIPEVKASFLMTLARPIVGAAVAVPVLAVIESGVINIAEGQRDWAMLAFCFLAGFSERWFFGIMEKLEKQKT